MTTTNATYPQLDLSAARPPAARRDPQVSELHGDRRVDEYTWLREKDAPEVLAYLEAENAHTAAVMKPLAAFEETLYQEMLGRIQQTDQSVPYRFGDHLYYWRTEKGKQYRCHCRRRAMRAGQPDAPEEITLDANALAEGLPYFYIGAFEVSPDGHLLAFSTDTTGFREYTFFVKDLRTGELLSERIEKTSSVAWAADSRTMFYTVEDSAKRAYRLFRHRLGGSDDALLYEEEDERFRLDVSQTRSRAFLLLTGESHTAAEVRFLPAGSPEGEWRLVAAREPDHEYDLEHHDARFYIRSNRDGRNFAIYSAPASDPRRENWREEVPHRPEVMVEELSMFAGHAVLQEREDGLPHLRVATFDGGLRLEGSHRIEFSEPVYSIQGGPNYEFEAAEFRFSYESLVTPLSVYDYDMATCQQTLRKRIEVLGGYDPSLYISERRYASAPDGTRIPISIVYRRDRPKDSSAPVLLTGYGAYGISLPVGFSSHRISLLDRGFAAALAHVRGGGELGKPWHDQGRMMRKKNSFTDFIAAGDLLVSQGYTSRRGLMIQGGSAGGLLIGAVLNLRPDLCRAAILQVPFVDVLNSMLDSSLPLTVGEFEEWGNPAVKEEYEYMRGYCPYTNLRQAAYPAILVRASLHDSQVMYWEPAKYTARLRTLKTDSNPLLLKTNLTAGHGGASGRYDALREMAFVCAFLFSQTGDANPGAR